MSSSWLLALAGGVMIGGASALVLLAHGRVAGVSGIVGGLLQRGTGDRGWRLAFLGGLVAVGVIVHLAAGGAFGLPFATDAVGPAARPLPFVIAAGVFVGYGTRLGSGCTSGHGVCGLARLSPRSMVAVATFMTTGMLTVLVSGGAP